VVFMGIDRFRERSAAARKEAAEAETRRLLAAERRVDADMQAQERAAHREITKQFNVLIRASKLNTHAQTEELKRLVDQMALDRTAHAQHVDKIINASEARYQAFHAEIQSFKKDHLASIEQFGSRITSELSTGLSNMGKEFAQKHKEAVVLVAREQAAMQQSIVNHTVAALRDMNLLQTAAIEPAKPVTGPLPDINISGENVTVTQNEPKGTNDAQVTELPALNPNRPPVSDSGLRASTDAGTDTSGNDAGDHA
jgi:hypothetical protein